VPHSLSAASQSAADILPLSGWQFFSDLLSMSSSYSLFLAAAFNKTLV
jgi:hypothetical protein